MDKPILSWKAIIIQLALMVVNLAFIIVIIFYSSSWLFLVNVLAFLMCGFVGIGGLIDRINLRRKVKLGQG